MTRDRMSEQELDATLAEVGERLAYPRPTRLADGVRARLREPRPGRWWDALRSPRYAFTPAIAVSSDCSEADTLLPAWAEATTSFNRSATVSRGKSRRATARSLVASWIEAHPPRNHDAWHPYPLSTRVGNWIAARIRLDAGRCLLIGFGTGEEKRGHDGTPWS